MIDIEEKDGKRSVMELVFGMMVPENKLKSEENEERDRNEVIMEAIITGNIHQLLKIISTWYSQEGKDLRLQGLFKLVLAGYDIIRLNRYSF